MKKFVGYLTLTTFLFSHIAFAENEETPSPMEEVPETINVAEDPCEAFNKGQFVGNEVDYFATQRRIEITKNWGIALGSVIIGVAALVFAKKN